MGQPGQTSLSERLRVIEAEIAAGQTDSALANCQRVFTHYPRALAVQRVLGEIYLAQRKPREALGALDRALAGDPEDARACCARAIIYQMHGDPVAALSWYRRACDARPDDQALRATYLEMANRLGRPPYQPSRVGLARLYMRGGLFTHAIREWETLIAENSDLLEAQVGLVETLWRVERYAEAEEMARRVLANTPACVKPLLIAGIIARDTGRAADAERYLQRAAELDPDNRIARALFADRAMGDPALRMQFWGDEPVIEAMPLAPTPSAPPGMRTTERPQARPAASPFAAPASMPPTSAFNGGPALTGRPSLADLSAALSRPDLSQHLTQALPPLQQPGNLPPDFHSMLKETENILWGPEHSDPGAFPTMAMPAPQQPAPQQPAPPPPSFMPQTAAPPFTAPQPPVAAPKTPQMTSGPSGALGPTGPLGQPAFMPPAFIDNQLEMGDTEARRALRWVQWLQAQGARMRSDDLARSRPSGSLDALLNAAQPETPQAPVVPPFPFGGGAGQPAQAPAVPPYPFGSPAQQPPAQPRPAAPEAPMEAPWAAAFGSAPAPSAGPTGLAQPPAPFVAPGAPEPPVAPTHADDLRAMFAQLETPPPAASRAAPVPSQPAEPIAEPVAEPVNELRDMFAQFAPAANPAPAARPTFDQPASQPASQPAAAQPETQWPAALADAFEWPAEPAAQPSAHAGPSAHGYASPDMTLEALEDAHASSGFQPLTLEAGTLAAFAGAPTDASGESARALETFFQGPEEPPISTFSEPTPPAAPAIAPTDYPARLAHARDLRDAGNLDEALVEYRALLKNAPDLLHDVKSDLEASLDAQPEHPEIHRLLGDARIRQGDYMAALESLNRSVSLSQQSDE